MKHDSELKITYYSITKVCQNQGAGNRQIGIFTANSCLAECTGCLWIAILTRKQVNSAVDWCRNQGTCYSRKVAACSWAAILCWKYRFGSPNYAKTRAQVTRDVSFWSEIRVSKSAQAARAYVFQRFSAFFGSGWSRILIANVSFLPKLHFCFKHLPRTYTLR